MYRRNHRGEDRLAPKEGRGIAASLCVLSAAVVVASVVAARVTGYRYSVSASRDTYNYGLLSSTVFLGVFLVFLAMAVRVRSGRADALGPLALAAGPLALLMTIAATDAWALPAVDAFLVGNPLVNTTAVYVTSYGLAAAVLMAAPLAVSAFRSARTMLPEMPPEEGGPRPPRREVMSVDQALHPSRITGKVSVAGNPRQARRPKEKVVITGGAGFLGSHLADLLGPRSEVVILDNLSTGWPSNLKNCTDEVELVEGDVLDYELLLRLSKGASAIVHFAALTSAAESQAEPLRYHEVNATGSLRVLEAARHQDVPRAILASSAAVYGNSPGLPKVEHMVPEPTSPYGASKVAAEQYFRAYNGPRLQTTVLRFFNVYGPRQSADSPYAGVIPRFAGRFLRGKPPTIYGTGEQTRDFLYVGDAARATLLALEIGGGGRAYNIATGRATSILELARAMGDTLGLDLEPEWGEPRSGDILHSYADTGLAEKELGFRPIVTLKDGLRLTLETA